MDDSPFDLFVIGGGVNGCGIARDAAGRGLRVALAEMGDVGGATSSASTKLIHGGLRYLEYFELRLVRESLAEREVLLRMMPHIARPMRFVLPYHAEMRFEGETPASRLLSLVMPWTKGRRPAWVIRLGLFLYDHLGGRRLLLGTRGLDLARDPAGAALRPEYRRAFEYSDVWVQDARLVALCARDAAERGAQVMVRTRVTGARRVGDLWVIDTDGGDGPRRFHARALVNAGGPWVERVLDGIEGVSPPAHVRLVRGSHIVVPRLFDHDRSYFLQGRDGRIVFAIPFEDEFTLIGTTEADHPDPDAPPHISGAERDYLLDFVNGYFQRQLTTADIVWTYSGVRPLFDDGAGAARAATRDYVLALDNAGPPLLSVFGGKLTTFRRLSDHALAKLRPFLPVMGAGWTDRAPLPGGAFPVRQAKDRQDSLLQDYPFLSAGTARRLFRAYGMDAWQVLGEATGADDLGHAFGAGLSEAEVRWLMTKEFARSADDVIWRRSKLGLYLTPAQVQALDDWMVERLASR
ncbi:glycerol-3-phosphate dehydrogenase [Thalassovita sp.]|uniref:glycerol-3-phosphate dehydrogenase n=1 Tax=Thalassovita sp. TaxID=1979401 RepID=UPI0029DE5CC5|nr:glycerol-3-phosphate dehydrogenase [Thalassovita sp.]